jgi:hypothetical protein
VPASLGASAQDHTRRLGLRGRSSAAWLKLGEILVESGDISHTQLAEALARKQETGRRIGDELVAGGELKPERLAVALKLQRRLAIIACAAALIPFPRDAHGTQARATTAVSTTVADSVSVRPVYQAEQLVVSPADVRRGYVDVPAGSRYAIRCAKLCLFEFKATANLFKSVRVTGLEAAAEFGMAGATLVHKPAAHTPTDVAIHYRFTLPPGFEAGAYRWPLALSVTPM